MGESERSDKIEEVISWCEENGGTLQTMEGTRGSTTCIMGLGDGTYGKMEYIAPEDRFTASRFRTFDAEDVDFTSKSLRVDGSNGNRYYNENQWNID